MREWYEEWNVRASARVTVGTIRIHESLIDPLFDLWERLMPTAMLSEHFSYAEMIYSQTAARMGLSNEPDSKSYENLKRLCAVLEQVRMICGNVPVTITSGYRSPEVNKACGGSSTSAHMSGLAADFIIPGCGDPLTVCQKLEQYMAALGIDQLIWEYGDWVHMGLAPSPGTPRCMAMTIDSNGTRNGFA